MQQQSRILVGLLAWLILATSAWGEGDILVREGDSVRFLATEHLGDAELWPELLRANGLESVAEVKAGMRLKLPQPEIVKTQSLLKESQEKIQQANRLRARLFAPVEIGNAVALRDRALEEKRLGNWKVALGLMEKALAMADAALEICEAKRNVAAEAQLVDKRGSVERRTPADVVWRGAELYGMFAEGDRVRTLVGSSAELLFGDDSRLRMDENSQLVIQQMRSNLLENRQQAKVSLVSGDLFALLGGNPSRSAFDVDIPGVKLGGNSRDFYVRQNDQDTKLANYQGELEVEAKGSRITLEENEGVAVDAAGISGKKSLLPRPRSLNPSDAEVVYSGSIHASWAAVEGALRYWLELADDRSFKSLRHSDNQLQDAKALLEGLGEGSYYWRVAAVDEDGFPGPWSETSQFQVIHDRQPPHLVVHRPIEGEILSHSPLEVVGVVEPGAQLTLNGQSLEVGTEGDFSTSLELLEGENRLTLIALDAAGNPSEVVRLCHYTPEPALFFTPDPSLVRDQQGRFLSLGPVYHLRANTLPHSSLRLLDEQGQSLAAAKADGEGRVSVNLSLPSNASSLTAHLRSPGGAELQQEMQLLTLGERPEILLDVEPPHHTREQTLTLKGQLRRGHNLTLNGQPLELLNDRFTGVVELKDGWNEIILEAEDAQGQHTRLMGWTILDQQPPKPSAQSIKAFNLGDRRQLDIQISAEDASPLTRGAAFTLTAGDFHYRGTLRLNGDGRSYRGLVELPKGVKATPEVEVTLSDLLGNSTQIKMK